MKWQDFKKAGRDLVMTAIGRQKSSVSPTSAIEQYLETHIAKRVESADHARWAELQGLHPQTYDAMQRIQDICPELQPAVQVIQMQGQDRYVEYTLTLPEVGEPKHFPVRIAMQRSTGRIFQAGSAGGALSDDATTARLLYDFAGREGYINVVGKPGLSGTRHVVEAGAAVLALRPTPRPILRSVPTNTHRT